MMYSSIALISGLLLFFSAASRAYEIGTHNDFSLRAVNNSVIAKDPSLLENLGLSPVQKNERFPNSDNDRHTIRELVQDGARFEDDDLRPVNHFYDPVANRTLELDVLDTETSPDWALEDTREIFLQDYSLRDARDYLYKALTLAEEDERKQNFGLTFQTLGQVIHHIQDMAQPQHVRLDEHCVHIHDRFVQDVLADCELARASHAYGHAGFLDGLFRTRLDVGGTIADRKGQTIWSA